MPDTIIHIGSSLLQHGLYNDRIYLMKFTGHDCGTVLSTMDELVEKHGYSKIFIKVAKKFEPLFLHKGFVREALVPDFNSGGSYVFMGKFMNGNRRHLSEETKNTMDNILKTAKARADGHDTATCNDRFMIRELSPPDTDDLAGLYCTVFESYPFPIFDRNYLLKTMQDNVVYFGCFDNGRLIAASSSETDRGDNSVEMTDFATLPPFRGKKLAFRLLQLMEKNMKQKGFVTAFTIARALSYGMNITFSKAGYTYGGTLINNTNISGNIESMNIWYKSLR